MASKSVSSSTTFPKGDLKHLGFLQSNASFYSSKSSELASGVYSTLRAYVPKSLTGHLSKIEDTASSYTHPLVSQLQDRSGSILRRLDGSIDYAVKKGDSILGSTVGNLHKTSLHRFTASKDAGVQKVKDLTETIRSQGVTGTAKSVADYAKASADSAYKSSVSGAKFVREKTAEGVQGVYNLPLVQKSLSEAQKLYGYLWQVYMSGHDTVVGHPAYHKVYKSTVNASKSVESTTLYQKGKTQLYPTVAPYADPALSKIQGNSYYKAAVDHLKPVNGKLH